MHTVQEALEKLKSAGITSSVQMLRRWIRDGEIKAIEPPKGFKKEGYRIEKSELERFIESRNPLYEEVKRLREENKKLLAEQVADKTEEKYEQLKQKYLELSSRYSSTLEEIHQLDLEVKKLKNPTNRRSKLAQLREGLDECKKTQQTLANIIIFEANLLRHSLEATKKEKEKLEHRKSTYMDGFLEGRSEGYISAEQRVLDLLESVIESFGMKHELDKKKYNERLYHQLCGFKYLCDDSDSD